MSDEPMVYEGSSAIVYRASSLGFCDRALVAARLGYPALPPPAKLQQTFDAGHQAEAWAISSDGPLNVRYAQDPVQLTIPGTDPPVVLQGHLDGLKDLPPPLAVVVEIKSQSPDMYDRWTEDAWTTDDLWVKYAWQVSVYMWAAGNARGGNAELDVVRVRRPGEGELYQYTVHHYARPFHSLDEIYARVRSIEQYAREGQLPACDKGEQWGCPYMQLHDQREVVMDDDLDDACRWYARAKADTKNAKAAEDEARRALLEVLGERKDVLTFGGYSVKYTTYKTREKVIPPGEQTRLTVSEVGL